MAYFTNAVEIAERSLGKDSDNPLLKRLFDDAKARRKRFAKEENAMTSAAQIGEYEGALEYILSAKTDELITTYNQDGTFKARLPRPDALRELENRARADVRNNVASYVDSANRLLDAGNRARRRPNCNVMTNTATWKSWSIICSATWGSFCRRRKIASR